MVFIFLYPFSCPHFPVPHFPVPHFSVPHFPVPHFPVPHFPVPIFPSPIFLSDLQEPAWTYRTNGCWSSARMRLISSGARAGPSRCTRRVAPTPACCVSHTANGANRRGYGRRKA